MFNINRVIVSVFLFGWVMLAVAQERATPAEAYQMDNARLESLIARVDKDYQGREGLWEFQLEGVPLRVVTDKNANRMRIYAPIIKADSIDKDKLYRLMQANFDSTLDARYAIAQGMLWGTFIHPLSSLTDQNFLSGIGQTVNIVISYGNAYSSGVLTFGGGDSGQLQQEILERLKRLSETI